MIRLKFIVEGQTEETFVRDLLADHLAERKVYASARCVETGKKRIRSGEGRVERVFRGGMTSYERARRDIVRWIKEEEHSPEVYLTTMFDLYGLPGDFPQFEAARKKATGRERVEALEEALALDIAFDRFIPYIQLHEFEALILSQPEKIAPFFEKKTTDRAIRNLVELCASQSPEEIDDGETTAPSKRILKEIPQYEGAKPAVPPQIAQAIGLERIRRKCPHFNGWLSRLELLGHQR
jgi:hypothetical protein